MVFVVSEPITASSSDWVAVSSVPWACAVSSRLLILRKRHRMVMTAAVSNGMGFADAGHISLIEWEEVEIVWVPADSHNTAILSCRCPAIRRWWCPGRRATL